MIYLYGLLLSESAEPVTDCLEGLAGQGGEISCARCGDYHLIYEPHDGSEILPRRRSLLSHARVLEAAMEAGTLLPMRFGMTCRSVQEVDTLVRRDAGRIKIACERIKDHTEIGVRVSATEEAALEAALASRPDLRALRDRLAQSGPEAHFRKVEFGRALGDVVAARRRDAQKGLLSALRPLVSDHVLKAPETDFEPLRAELLVPVDAIDSVTRALEDAVAALTFAGETPCEARIVGPGPAFHFVDLRLDLAPAADAA